MAEVKFCPNCGKQVIPSASFCAFCGYNLGHVVNGKQSIITSTGPGQSDALTPQTPREPLACPVCLHVDQVRKVTSLVADGTVHSKTHGSTQGIGTLSGTGTRVSIQSETDYSVRSQTLLSQKLSVRSNLGGFEAINLVISAVWFILIVYWLGTREISLVVVVIILGIIYGFAIYEPTKKRLLQKTQIAQMRWEQLYYCGRDDVVFDPKVGVAVRPEQLQDYLNKRP